MRVSPSLLCPSLLPTKPGSVYLDYLVSLCCNIAMLGRTKGSGLGKSMVLSHSKYSAIIATLQPGIHSHLGCCGFSA